MKPEHRWTKEKAWNWYRDLPWLCGFNFLPSSAVNPTEMWMEDTFDIEGINRELNRAEELGFNSCRVFLQFLVWHQDPEGMIQRIEQFLETAWKHNITTALVLFDDCAFGGEEPYLGKQNDPIPGVHNPCWTPSPGYQRVIDRSAWPRLEQYISTLIHHFRSDPRVVAWDLYNEPGPGNSESSLDLLMQTFAWARAVDPEQPLTACIWNEDQRKINAILLEQSDIISFHNYGNLQAVQSMVEWLKQPELPLICTEWMARTVGSRWETHLPYWKQEGIGCYSWGLVTGRTQTRYAWGSSPGTSEPEIWHHDIFHADGSPYDSDETAFIKRFLKQPS